MKLSFARTLLVLPVLAAACFSAQAQIADADKPIFTVGMKLWQNKWNSWDAFATGSENYSSGSEASVIPSVAVRYKDFLVSGSYFAKKEYGFVGTDGSTFRSKRRESDALVGYYVLPTLAVTLGYKEVKQDFGTASYSYKGPVIGAAASAPLTKGFSLYGNFGYGPMKARLPVGASDVNGQTKFDVDYYLGEVGIAYSIDLKDKVSALRAMTFTLGYRSQVLATNDYQVQTYNTTTGVITGRRSATLRDTTEGLALGVSVSF